MSIHFIDPVSTMFMRSGKVVAPVLVFVFSVLSGAAQSDGGQTQSLGDVARALRQEKAQPHTSSKAVGRTETSQAGGQSLGDIAREIRRKKGLQLEAAGPSSEPDAAARAYMFRVSDLLRKEDFAALDAAADEARTSKSRLPGGAWTLFMFYSATTQPERGSAATDAEWEAQISILKRWVEQRPQSVTARVALGDAYLGYGWKARGRGYSNTVSESAWKTMEERMEMAAATLIEAYKLPTKCPYWYESMQNLLRTAGIEKPKMRELFEKAIAFEPSYYHFYREYATYLLPKWGGNPGEAEAFAEETYRRVGGKQGAFLYFEIASVINCNCSETVEPLTLSWDHIKEGYDFMAKTYGTTNLKRNRLAAMAVQAEDRRVAHEMFEEIGESWDRTTWRSQARFQEAKAWAQ